MRPRVVPRVVIRVRVVKRPALDDLEVARSEDLVVDSVLVRFAAVAVVVIVAIIGIRLNALLRIRITVMRLLPIVVIRIFVLRLLLLLLLGA